MNAGKSAAPSALAVGLALASVYLVWGSTYLAIRVGLEGYPPFLMGSLRFLAASAVFYATAGFHREAQHFATGKALRLIDGKKLLEQLLALPQETRIALLKEITAGDYRTPSCPQCENRMLRRSGQAGQPDFWGCRNYPRCKARPIPIRTGT